MHFRFSAAIFDLPVTPTSKRIHTSFIVLLDPKNVEVAFGSRCYHVYKPVPFNQGPNGPWARVPEQQGAPERTKIETLGAAEQNSRC